jgi:hypothetical protein
MIHLRLDRVRWFDLPVESHPSVRVPEGSRLVGVTVVRPAYLGGTAERLSVCAQVASGSDSEVTWRLRLVSEAESFSDWAESWLPIGTVTVASIPYAVFVLEPS